MDFTLSFYFSYKFTNQPYQKEFMTWLNAKRPGNKIRAGKSDLVSLDMAGKLLIYRSLFFFYQKHLTKLGYSL